MIRGEFTSLQQLFSAPLLSLQGLRDWVSYSRQLEPIGAHHKGSCSRLRLFQTYLRLQLLCNQFILPHFHAHSSSSALQLDTGGDRNIPYVNCILMVVISWRIISSPRKAAYKPSFAGIQALNSQRIPKIPNVSIT